MKNYLNQLKDTFKIIFSETIDVDFPNFPDVTKKPQKEILTQREAMEYLGCSKSTLNRWVKEKRIIQNGIGGRVYYKMSDISNAMIPTN